MLDFEDFLVYIKLAKILSKTFPFLKTKKTQADCFLAEHKRGIAVFSIRATKTGCTEDSKFCSCCADILNQMTSPTAWILWKARFQWLQTKMKSKIEGHRSESHLDEWQTQINQVYYALFLLWSPGAGKAGCMTGISKSVNKSTAFSSSVCSHPTQALPTQE